ncbi:8-amino-7-oxononanoate synthase [Moraxella sp. ZY210820]|uniref:aminotransferase class I/II-fold pyridoxal phosphate-dependent enzyme n=1 Tax=unclassified Moraxella TaxID=2685852 RepID=UPI0027304039|nr:8-amino-7-oxononanoate synthase [Moraxella sp. ZY210820]WLF83555.1 8-amino-7-oxononanoate synthase [Moraxella sp. ZY210820]
MSKNKYLEHYAQKLDELKANNNFREFHSIIHNGKYMIKNGKTMLNLASNDYLGLASDDLLKQEFFDTYSNHLMSSSSSRLLTGNFAIYQQLESELDSYFGRPALLFNSGYHMNLGILPAICDDKTLILADKLIHASIIDGILLSKAKLVRYPHQDLVQLESLLHKYQDDDTYNKIVIVTESIFSMDGDETDLKKLVDFKHQFDKVLLYVDDAHAMGVRGERGLGCAEQYNVMNNIDFLVGTFGKACASVGGYIICDKIIKHYLINFMRPLIFSTALPPINMAWTSFILNKIINDKAIQIKRERLDYLSNTLINKIKALDYTCPSSSHIVPVILGANEKALSYAQQLQQSGHYIMAVRHPTVAKNQARLRICLNANMTDDELTKLLYQLEQLKQNDKE